MPTVILPAAVPIALEFVIVALVVDVATSLIVPEFNAIALAPITRISPALVAALAAPIVSENTNSLVPVPEA